MAKVSYNHFFTIKSRWWFMSVKCTECAEQAERGPDWFYWFSKHDQQMKTCRSRCDDIISLRPWSSWRRQEDEPRQRSQWNLKLVFFHICCSCAGRAAFADRGRKRLRGDVGTCFHSEQQPQHRRPPAAVHHRRFTETLTLRCLNVWLWSDMF